MSLKDKRINKLLILIIILISSNAVFGQRIIGTVIDAEDNTSLPFVNILIKGTSIGGISDIDGKFKLKSNLDISKNDSIVFSFVGYKTKIIAVKNFKAKSIVYLDRSSESLKEVVLTADISSYDEYLMRQILINKRYNDPSKIKKSQYNETALLSVFLANLDKSIVEKRRFKKNKTAFIVESDSTVMMPILLSKEIIRHRFNQNKNINNEQIISIEQEGTLEQLTSLVKTTINKKITQNINFYDENIDLLGRSFQSPISSNYKTHYRIYLSDSTVIDNVKHYKFEYYPKNEKSVAFDGSFWVESKAFALTELEATLPIVANVNFIKKLSFEVEYDKVGDKNWYVKSQKSKTEFSFVNSKKKEGRYFSVQKHQKFTDFELDYDEDETIEIKNPIIGESISISIEEGETKLDSLEFRAITGIRELKNNGYIKFIDRFGAMTLNGYYNLNKFDLGPYFDFYYKNGIEGSRVTLPLRTSEKMSKNFDVGGYIGYGFKDKDFKYGLSAEWLLPLDNRTVLSARYSDDFESIAQSRYIEFVQENPYSRGGGNILSVFANNSNLNFALLRRKHIELSLSYDATENIRYLVRPFYNRFKENEFNRLNHNSINVEGFRSAGALIDIRYSQARNFDQQFFSRIYYGTTKPVYHVTAEVGQNKIIDNSSDYSKYYARLNASVKKKFLLGATFIKAFVDAGYIFGEVPYPLLNNPSGNQSIGLARFNYNLLDPTSFSSDAYASLHLSFNGGGFIFNKISWLSNLNIRESMSFKAFYGTLRDNHSQFFAAPIGLVELGKEPYMEAGLGVGNIFKVLRIEYVRRLNSAAFFNQISSKHGVKLRIEVSF
ncbi:MAG: hypothetical protein ACI9M9_001744 [Flavobacteriaceae bacterium]|jgi:hypothetical protein